MSGGETPTLKIRVRLPDDASHWGADCHSTAARLVGEGGVVLDAKWGREPTKWHETGRGWGRVHLSAEERGYVQALTAADDNSATVDRLLGMIERLTGYQS